MITCDGCEYLIGDKNQIEECYCEKLNGKIFEYGCCDNYNNHKERDKAMNNTSYCNKRRTNRYERKRKYKRKLKYIADHSHGYPSGAYYVAPRYENWEPSSQDYYSWVKENYRYIRREYRANHAPGYSGFLKKLASRKFRRFKGELANGCAYKKTFDYWWELT